MTTPLAFEAVQLREPVLPMKLVTAHLALSFTTNVVATMLIAYKLWWVHRLLYTPAENDAEYLSRLHRKSGGVKALGSLSSVQKVLVALIESGSAYCALQVKSVSCGGGNRIQLYLPLAGANSTILSSWFYAISTVLCLWDCLEPGFRGNSESFAFRTYRKYTQDSIPIGHVSNGGYYACEPTTNDHRMLRA